MILYEVNLNISNEIFDEYYRWLLEHIKIMLKIKGFKKASINKLYEIQDENSQQITVLYELNSKEDLNNYLSNYAVEMRNDGIQRFGQKFSATRRKFETIDLLENS